MPSKYPRPLECDPSELEDIDRILHLASHRHHNQFRVAKFWKEFQILKRNISKILGDLKDHLRTRTSTSRAAVEDRVEFVLQFLMPKCYRAFGALVADNQFAPLGLMLMGTLARINKIILPLQREPEIISVPVAIKKKDLPTEDIGEVVKREDYESTESQLSPKPKKQLEKEEKAERKSKKKARLSSTLPSSENSTSKPPKKKRKKGNAIDDLFSSIL